MLKKTRIKQIGKKGKAWEKAKKILLKDARNNPSLVVIGKHVYGKCIDCHHHHLLTPDHKKKRSQGGTNDKENIEWVCNEPPCMCHDKRDNRGDPMNKKVKKSKASWQSEHKCISCKAITSLLICHSCGKRSIK